MAAKAARELKFDAVLERAGEGDSWILVSIPFDVEDTFGTKGRVSVSGTINGVKYRNSIFPNGDGNHHMMINKELQKQIKAGAGDPVLVVMQKDGSPRPVEIPPDLKTELANNKTARTAFEKLSPSRQKEFANWVATAKRDETRKERIGKTISLLLEGRTLKGKLS